VFRFNTALGANNVDTITDFKVNVDEIELDNAIFKVLGTSLTASEFVANASGTAQNGAQHILYDTTDGRLFYDADGQGGQARVHFATLKAGLALDHLDFDVI
jgi:Ca2+-binding RTX toxin-like protein